MQLAIKICGIQNPDNAKDVAGLHPDMLGFIFYNKSPRYVGEIPDPELFKYIPSPILKTGVFVNADESEIISAIQRFKLNQVQLHGDETPGLCKALFKQRVPVIKAFRIHPDFDFQSIETYSLWCKFFLFDTRSIRYGGTGIKFDWKLLQSYRGVTPFLLSGGICEQDDGTIRAVKHPMLAGVDLNSGFEISPGLKDIDKLRSFISCLRTP